MTYRLVRRRGHVELHRSNGDEWIVVLDGSAESVGSVVADMAAEARKREQIAGDEARDLERVAEQLKDDPTASETAPAVVPRIARRALLEAQVEHRRGRRALRCGDVLEESGSGKRAVVLTVDRPSHQPDGNTQLGTACLGWQDPKGVKRLTVRKLSTLRSLHLVAVGVEIFDGPAARHRCGLRGIRVGDVLRDPHRKRDAVVGEIDSLRVRLDWLDSGRSTRRTKSTLRWLELVREGPAS